MSPTHSFDTQNTILFSFNVTCVEVKYKTKISSEFKLILFHEMK